MSSVTIYEHVDMKGKKLEIDLNVITINQVYSLGSVGMQDLMSSLRWDIKDGYKFIIYEDAEGQGRQLGFTGTGVDNNTKLHRDFNDKASSYRFILDNSVPEFFDVVSPKAKMIKFNSKGSVHGTDGGIMNEHYQGVQIIDENHIIICTSDFQGAYFFIVRWRSGFLSGEIGTVIKLIRINDDFNGMKLDHPGGMQLLGNIVAIPIEYIHSDSMPPPMSSIVFYNISDRANPKKIGFKIDRQDKSACAVGIANYKDSILLVVGGRDTKDLDFYFSLPGQNSITDKTVFKGPKKTWEWNHSTDRKGWLNNIWEAYQSLNLIKDIDGKIFLVGAKYDNDWFELYSVDILASEKSILKKISKKAISCENRASPEFGSGIYMSGRRIHFIVTGSGRSNKREESSIMVLNYFS